jgi:tRNA U34 5-methylaminomethyl-2-thiouridine-forming methyltransferase MnmC
MSNSENKTEGRLVITADGSHSVWNAEVGQHYHSIFGAWQESQRVFIELGLHVALARFDEIRLFEMGFGTGLNALLTLNEAGKAQKRIQYTAVEAFPLPLSEAEQLNFDQVLHADQTVALHQAAWDQWVNVTSYFRLWKHQGKLQDFRASDRYNLVYYDAFAPEGQPELWTQEIFELVAGIMEPGGILTTYCSKGYVQRNLKAAGFLVEKHPGPARKREVLRAILQ